MKNKVHLKEQNNQIVYIPFSATLRVYIHPSKILFFISPVPKIYRLKFTADLSVLANQFGVVAMKVLLNSVKAKVNFKADNQQAKNSKILIWAINITAA